MAWKPVRTFTRSWVMIFAMAALQYSLMHGTQVEIGVATLIDLEQQVSTLAARGAAADALQATIDQQLSNLDTQLAIYDAAMADQVARLSEIARVVSVLDQLCAPLGPGCQWSLGCNHTSPPMAADTSSYWGRIPQRYSLHGPRVRVRASLSSSRPMAGPKAARAGLMIRHSYSPQISQRPSWAAICLLRLESKL